jgi:hypothetical protein
LRRAAIDHAADRNPVALAEGGDPEHMAEGVEGHFRLIQQSILTVVTRGIQRVNQIAP